MNNKWDRIKRILAILMSVALWILSVNFSQKGFGITLPSYAWAGYVLALSVTIMELVLNSGTKLNPTIFASGVIAYLYGVGTNVYGILAARTPLTQANMWDWSLAIGVGLIIEVAPEPFLLYGMNLNLGDLVSTLMSNNPFRRVQKNHPVSFIDTHFSDGQDTRQDIQDVHIDTPKQQDSWTNSKTTRMVRGYLHAHPGASVRQVADGIRQPPSSIGVIMKKMRERGEIRT